MDLLFKLEFLLIILGVIAPVLRASICDTNEDSRRLIRGDNSDAVNNFVEFVERTNTFLFDGDNVYAQDNCRRNMHAFKHRQRHSENKTEWILDCWVPTECVLVVKQDKGGPGIYKSLLKAVSNSLYQRISNLLRMRVNAIFLPLDERNTVAYTFLPYYIQQRSAVFVTSMLSGCSVFIATADNINCNVILMHSNRYEQEDADNDHKQAMFVLEKVHSVNKKCRYRIQRRWAIDHSRTNIEKHSYRYPTAFYNMKGPYNFIYGYNLGAGGDNGKWKVCLKELHLSAPLQVCHQIV